MQQLAWYVTLVVVIAIAAVFTKVAVQSGTAEDHATVQGRAYRIRAWLFWALVIGGIAIAAGTLRTLPYAAASAGGSPQVINATGHQWYWDLDQDVVTAGEPVEFRVTSADVNHGFGIYDPDLRIVAQVQAMPGYINVLRHTFERPGIYQVMCLEYCGIAHHAMIAEIEVQAP
ncbi:MAG: cytochrome c oxidase subunit I [Rubellimicrobium sp.]|nr:cytochrome c oxidase subunit I [Rubellimicrobium sp.]